MELEAIGAARCTPVMIYRRVLSGDELGPYEGARPFRAVVVIESSVGEKWQWDVSHWLLESGCLYMLAWGEDCGSWDDSVDWADLVRFDFNVPDDHLVMTTWHENQSLEEVLRFARNAASSASGAAEIVETLILHISEKDRSEEFGKMWAAAEL